jgi:nitrite reductase (NADH) small subunit
MSGWIEVGVLGDLPKLGARVVQSGGEKIAVFRTEDDRVFALVDRCPHKAGPLSQGIVHNRRVTCPLHNFVIDLETGEAVAPDRGKVRTIPVRLEGDRILLKLDSAIQSAVRA